ncbi:hypothetical protein QAD02_011048 [Eretmocerus hayati]|uniref:Uncharacterized protein n=1 Tax=Eretmocerus hayati TaxID=131215 RepID=A0ACC2NVV7_9HYME|nr:hypothetical protein QAD02_011048 [Eretmocerus hayati]
MSNMINKKPIAGWLKKTDRSTWEWKLDNSCIKDDYGLLYDSVGSPCITTETLEGREIEWKLNIVHLKPNLEGESHLYSVQLSRLTFSKISTAFRLIVKRRSESKYILDSGLLHHTFYGSNHPASREITKSSIIDVVSGKLIDDNLSIICWFFCPTCHVCANADSHAKRICDSLCKLKDDDILLKIIRTSGFGDVEFRVNGKVFRAHQTLLANQSKVFTENFNKTVSNQKVIVITDIDVEVFTEILRFVYFNEVHEIEKYAKGLLAAADKYSMEGLRQICEETMSADLSCQNAVKYLEITDIYELEELKKRVVEFIVSNVEKIMGNLSFLSLKVMKSSLLFGLIQAMGKKLTEMS